MKKLLFVIIMAAFTLFSFGKKAYVSHLLLSWVVALPIYERKTGLKPATLSLEG